MHRIRRCVSDDLAEIVRLSELWASEAITYGLAPNAISDLIPKLGDYFFVAKNDSRIVGYTFGTVHISEGSAVMPQGTKYLEIDEIYVHPDYRSDGIGHLLIDRLLNEAESHGITRSLVYSASKQWDKIVGFYERHGFKMWYVQMYK